MQFGTSLAWVPAFLSDANAGLSLLRTFIVQLNSNRGRNSHSDRIIGCLSRTCSTPVLSVLSCLQVLQVSSQQSDFLERHVNTVIVLRPLNPDQPLRPPPTPGSSPHPSLIQLLISPSLVPDAGNPLSSNKDPATPPSAPAIGPALHCLVGRNPGSRCDLMWKLWWEKTEGVTGGQTEEGGEGASASRRLRTVSVRLAGS